MEVNDSVIPDDMNWADYCDFLADEALLDSQNRRMPARVAVAVAANQAAKKISRLIRRPQFRTRNSGTDDAAVLADDDGRGTRPTAG